MAMCDKVIELEWQEHCSPESYRVLGNGKHYIVKSTICISLAVTTGHEFFDGTRGAAKSKCMMCQKVFREKHENDRRVMEKCGEISNEEQTRLLRYLMGGTND